MKGCAKIYDNALVKDGAVVDDNVLVYENAVVGGSTHISGSCKICGDAQLDGDIIVKDNTIIRGHCVLNGLITIKGDCLIHENAYVLGTPGTKGVELINCCLEGSCVVKYSPVVENAVIRGFAIVQDCAKIHGAEPYFRSITNKQYVIIDDHSKIMDHAEIRDLAHITDNACIGGNYKCYGRDFYGKDSVLTPEKVQLGKTNSKWA